MRVIIHRGSRQIGGSCIEVSAGLSRVVFDAGLPLDSDLANGPLAPAVAGLFNDTGRAVNALFISHAHVDHHGLVAASRSDVSVWLTAGTSKMIMAGGLFARQPEVPRMRQRVIAPGVPVSVGSLRVTAIPVDHSIYDAMAFMVEGDGRRLLYTGDLRFHGRKPGMARQLVRIARSAPLDALVIEGTRLGGRATEPNLTEHDLESQVVADIRANSSTVLAMYSPLNVDRFVTFFRAALKTKRILVIDPYQAFVLHLVHRQTRVPIVGANDTLRPLLPPHFQSGPAGRRLMQKRWAAALSKNPVRPDEIHANPERFIVLFRESMRTWLYRSGLPSNATCIFSYWPGYLREPRMKTLVEDVTRRGGRFLTRHASGHAHPNDLRQFVGAVRPRLLLPVHTTSAKTWLSLSSATRLAADGQPIEIP